MKIRMMNVEDVGVAPYNPRVDLQPGDPEYEDLRNSLEKFDIVDPLIYNVKTKRLVAGHQRLKIIRDHFHRKQVPVVEVSLNEDDEKALNVALNKIQGRFDDDKLAELLASLQSAGYDATLTGYKKEEIALMLEQKSPEVPESFTTIPGDIETEYKCPKCSYAWSGKPK
jgi:ParB-like chromosome segregation protein Spo0J